MTLIMVLIPLIILVVFGAALATAGIHARRAELARSERAADTTSFGHELFARALRLDDVREAIRQARQISAGSYVETQMSSLCLQLEAGVATQHVMLRRVAPLSGRHRELAITHADRAIAELEKGASALRELTEKVAEGSLGTGGGEGAIVERRAQAIRAAIEELDTITDLSFQIEDLMPDHELPPTRDDEPPALSGS